MLLALKPVSIQTSNFVLLRDVRRTCERRKTCAAPACATTRGSRGILRKKACREVVLDRVSARGAPAGEESPRPRFPRDLQPINAVSLAGDPDGTVQILVRYFA